MGVGAGWYGLVYLCHRISFGYAHWPSTSHGYQYRTECRASAFAFITSVGRFAGAGITFLVGAGVGTIGVPVALTSLAFLVGLLLLPFGEETKGRELPT